MVANATAHRAFCPVLERFPNNGAFFSVQMCSRPNSLTVGRVFTPKERVELKERKNIAETSHIIEDPNGPSIVGPVD